MWTQRQKTRAVASALVAAVALALVVAWRFAPPLGEGGAELPVIAAVPPFHLTSEQGRPFGLDDLRGKVWIANFVFTRCPTVCPAFTRTMAGLQPRAQEAAGALHLVSFSVDPDFDTPPVLDAYARRFGADPRRWTFLTGRPEALLETVVQGFKIGVSREGPEGDARGLLHGTHFVLVDGAGSIRGYYASTDPDAVERLGRDASALALATAAR